MSLDWLKTLFPLLVIQGQLLFTPINTLDSHTVYFILCVLTGILMNISFLPQLAATLNSNQYKDSGYLSHQPTGVRKHTQTHVGAIAWTCIHVLEMYYNHNQNNYVPNPNPNH